MSAHVPPPPLGLPPPHRPVRALRIGMVLAAVIFVAAGIVLIAWYSLHTMSQDALAPPQQIQKSSTGAGAIDVLASAPTGTEIEAAGRHRPALIAARQPEIVATPAQPAQARVDDDMTDAALAGRRAAWAQYYQQQADLQRSKFERTKQSLKADIDPPEQQIASATVGGRTVLTPGGTEQQQQQPKSFFEGAASNPATDYLPFTTTDPMSPYELKAGDIISAKLLSGLDSDSPGEVIGLVTKNVDDYATGTHILVPQGSRLVGTYDTAIAYGQTRVMVAWQRIIYPPPCSQSLDLGAMPGADQTGQAAFSDITENHYGKIFFNALLVSLFGAAVQLSQPPGSSFQQYNPIQTAGGAIGQQMGQLGAEFARRGLDVKPTQRIRQGYEFTILTTKDIAFSNPWQQGVCGDVDVTVASR
jgi:type IV secretory pathway VirB10-like protein